MSALDTIRPPHLPHGFIALGIVNQVMNLDHGDSLPSAVHLFKEHSGEAQAHLPDSRIEPISNLKFEISELVDSVWTRLPTNYSALTPLSSSFISSGEPPLVLTHVKSALKG